MDRSKVPCDIVANTRIHLDSHRLAFIVVLAASMLSPLSISVVGGHHSGKSVLINIAKLLVRDLCDHNLF